MKLVSYRHENQEVYGILHSEGIYDLFAQIGHIYPDLKSLLAHPEGLMMAKRYADNRPSVSQNDVIFLPVIPNPGKILCVGMNYAEKRAEFDAVEKDFVLFIRFADSQVGHLNAVCKPKESNEFDYEGELAVIIGAPCYRVKSSEALRCIAGYSCYMDGSVRDWQHSWFTAGKNWPKTGGFGPALTTIDEINDFDSLTIKTYLNSQLVQSDRLSNLIHKVPTIIEYISTFTPLEPGDVIITGSPGGVGKKRIPPLFMQVGDIVEVEISQIGRLTHPIGQSEEEIQYRF